MSATGTTTARPITINTKIGEALKEHPELLDVLLRQSPHFSRLKNPILRRIHGRLVTVGQAAAVAGIDPAALVRKLNAAIGQDLPEETQFTLPSMAGTPEPAWIAGAGIAISLDVREDQRNHADPFARIMAAIAQVRDGEIFYLRNTFEPLPLYDVLGKRGFVSWARKLSSDDWEIFFLKTGSVEKADGPRQAAAATKRATREDGEAEMNDPTASVTIDVADLTPPQPMMKILDALALLKPGETLLVHHKRRPAYLYPKLAELGYTHQTIEHGPDDVDIYIRKK